LPFFAINVNKEEPQDSQKKTMIINAKPLKKNKWMKSTPLSDLSIALCPENSARTPLDLELTESYRSSYCCQASPLQRRNQYMILAEF
jgi:hypothetical protein